jgi:hypothetical protein
LVLDHIPSITGITGLVPRPGTLCGSKALSLG